MQRINASTRTSGARTYLINLDPAVTHVPYQSNIDVRDSVDYKGVMQQYKLGPNGAILTCLNLFATQFNDVINILDARAPELDYVFVDTPGQIEVFTWSASGGIITDLLASKFPTVVLFVVDTPRCHNPTTFMSNMLYACSIMYKTRLPFVIVFNKIDVKSHVFATEWMADFELFQEALDACDKAGDAGGYMNSLTRSLALALDEFYSSITSVGVSAATGEGMGHLFTAVNAAGQQYLDEYLPELKDAMARRAGEEEARKQDALRRFAADSGVASAGAGVGVKAHPSHSDYPFVSVRDAVVGGSSLDLDAGYSCDTYEDGDESDD